MSPEHDRRRNAADTSDTAGWHSLDAILRQALEVQRDIGTPGATEFLQNIGIQPQVINRLLGPDAKVRAADREALAHPVAVADLPVSSLRKVVPPSLRQEESTERQ
jgi:hypothetical protein